MASISPYFRLFQHDRFRVLDGLSFKDRARMKRVCSLFSQDEFAHSYHPPFYDRFDELLRFRVLDFLSPRQKMMMQRVSHQLRNDVRYHNPLQYEVVESLNDAIGSGSQRANLDYRLERSRSLVEATRRLPGGEAVIRQAGQGGSILIEDPTAMTTLVHYLKECEAVGLIALVQQIPDTEEFLASIKELSPRLKVRAIQNWILDNLDLLRGIATLEIVNYKKAQLAPVHSLSVERAESKVFNFLPSAIALFTGLQALRLQNNLLKELPYGIGQLPLRELDLSRNQFTEFPEGIGVLSQLETLNLSSNRIALPDRSPLWRMKHLKHLDLSYNQITDLSPHFRKLAALESLDLRGNRFPTSHLERIIPLFAQNRLQIWIDSSHRLDSLMEEMRLQGAYTLHPREEGVLLERREPQSPVTPRLSEGEEKK